VGAGRTEALPEKFKRESGSSLGEAILGLLGPGKTEATWSFTVHA
jgi:hypothetical protein